MTTNEKKQTKCPVCGRFTSEKTLEAHYGRQAQKSFALTAEYEKVKETLATYQLKYDELARRHSAALDQILYLRTRGLWARIFNK